MSRSERRLAKIVFTKVVGHKVPRASRAAKGDRLRRRFPNLLHPLVSSTPAVRNSASRSTTPTTRGCTTLSSLRGRSVFMPTTSIRTSETPLKSSRRRVPRDRGNRVRKRELPHGLQPSGSIARRGRDRR